MAKAAKARIERGGLFQMAIIAVGVAAVTLLGHVPTADAAKPVTYIVLDAANGQVLNEHGADELNYPASLTKMMTLFLTFDALEHHQITLESQFTVSPHASMQQPSKLGLLPGSTISVHDLILSVVTHSANDSAVVLAEGIAGSEADFVVRMNREARLLGMTRTNFRNASGLPDRFQYTTARDLSKLALALHRSFPKEYGYFSTEEFSYRGAVYGNHNHLMAAFPGMDGIKTGFINASGFNLAASAVRNNRRLIGVIMGGRSAGSRDMEMAALLDDAFAHRGAPSAMLASSDTLRKTDALSPTVAAEPPTDRMAALADEAASHVEAAWTPRHHRTAHRSAHRRYRVAFRHHHGRRHGVVLAAYVHEQPVEAAVHGHRHHHDVHYRHVAARRFHGSGHAQLASHHNASAHHFARLHREHRRHVVKAAAGHHRGRRSLRVHRREALRSV